MRRIVAYFAVALLASVALADDDPTRTLNVLNGRGWQHLAATKRAEAYLTGLYDGLNYFGSHPEFRTDRASVGFTPAEIAAGVTAFYAADPARMRLPVPLAVSLFLRHAEGDSDEQISQRVAGVLKDLDAMIAKARAPKQ